MPKVRRNAERFRDSVRRCGGEYEFHLFECRRHPPFGYRLMPDTAYYDAQRLTARLLRRHRYITLPRTRCA